MNNLDWSRAQCTMIMIRNALGPCDRNITAERLAMTVALHDRLMDAPAPSNTLKLKGPMSYLRRPMVNGETQDLITAEMHFSNRFVRAARIRMAARDRKSDRVWIAIVHNGKAICTSMAE